MKNIKIIIMSIFWILVMLSIIPVTYWLEQDSCHDSGGVWDNDEHRCREDCLKWSAEYGCIQMTVEQAERVKVCNMPGGCLREADYYTICLNNHKAWNLDTKNCRFEFKAAECGKLSGNWQYPDICR